MKQTRFETECAKAQDADTSPDCQEICSNKTDYLRFDADRKQVNNKAVETVAWMKLLGLIR